MPDLIGPFWLLKSVVLVIGAVFGSFANVLIYRLPRGMSIVRPGSRCPACGQPIRWYDNVPLASWLWLRGRCRTCRAPISLRYPLVEICMAVLSVASLMRALAWSGTGPTLPGLLAIWAFVFAFCFLLVVITFVDLEHWRIPPVLTSIGAVFGVLLALSAGDLTGVGWVSSILGAALGSTPLVLLIEIYRRLAGREGMGYGDVFLMAMVGAYLGYASLPFVFFASSLQGLVVTVPMVLIRGRPRPPWEAASNDDESAEGAFRESIARQPPPSGLRHAPIPFGPFIALAAFEWLFFEDLIRSFVPWPG